MCISSTSGWSVDWISSVVLWFIYTRQDPHLSSWPTSLDCTSGLRYHDLLFEYAIINSLGTSLSLALDMSENNQARYQSRINYSRLKIRGHSTCQRRMNLSESFKIPVENFWVNYLHLRSVRELATTTMSSWTHLWEVQSMPVDNLP